MRNILLLSFLFCLSINSYSKTIHSIIFADTNDSNIGTGVQVNVSKITDWSNKIAIALAGEGYQYKTYVFTGNRCNKPNLLSMVKSLSCKDDIVIFFYGGHGGRSVSDTSKYPKLCLGSTDESQFVSLSNLKDMITSKNPMIQIIIADCCNSYYDGNVPQSRTMAMGSEKQVSSYSTRMIKELFLNKKGSIVCTGATKGEYGWINTINGGFFTYSFLESFNFTLYRDDEIPSWNTILSDTRDQTFEISQKAYLARRITKSQTPVFDIELQNEYKKPKENLVRIDFGNGYYIGQSDGRIKQGIGAYFFDDGSRFEGQYKDDTINGSGIFFWNENHYFSGTWINGKRTGFGIEVREDGSYSIQYWQDEVMKENPTLKDPIRINYSNGYYYGETYNGIPNGYGCYHWNDGSIFHGSWDNGVIEGNGLLSYPDNYGYFVGYWKGGKRTGCYGLQCLSNGSKLIGYWENEIYRDRSFIIYQQNK